VDLGDYRLTSVTAYRKHNDLDFGGFGGGFPAFGAPGANWLDDFANDKTQTTEELRITSPRGRTIEYVAGYLFYDQPTDSTITGGVAIPDVTWLYNTSNGLQRTRITTRSNALFADGKIRLSDATSILVGGRYTKDSVNGEFSNTAYDGGNLNTPFAPQQLLPSVAANTDADKLNGKLGLEHKLASDVLVFASASTGYVGPIINFRWTTGSPDLIKPQTNTNYTAGVKSQFMDRQLTINADIFYDKFSNFQTGYFDTSQGLQFVAENAATLVNRGAELEFSANLHSGLSLGESLAYVHSRFGDYCSGGTAPSVATPACTAPAGFAGAQYRGLTPAGVPDFTSISYIGYESSVGANLKVTGNLSYYYRSSSRNTPADAQTEVSGYGIANVNLFLGDANDGWRAGMYVRNLFDKSFASAVMSDPFAPPGTYINWVSRQSLRTVGGSVEFKW
jgi:iron complex outermembrane receptor protein